MTAIAKSTKTHTAAKKCCGWEEPAICVMTYDLMVYDVMIYDIMTYSYNI